MKITELILIDVLFISIMLMNISNIAIKTVEIRETIALEELHASEELSSKLSNDLSADGYKLYMLGSMISDNGFLSVKGRGLIIMGKVWIEIYGDQ